MNTTKATSIILSLAAAVSLTSCETTDGYASDEETAGRMMRRGAGDDAASEARAAAEAERRETQANISREQARLGRQSAAAKARAEELENASRMMHRGAADGEPLNDTIDSEYRAAQDEAEELDTASRMMGRGAAN